MRNDHLPLTGGPPKRTGIIDHCAIDYLIFLAVSTQYGVTNIFAISVSRFAQHCSADAR